MRQLFLEREMSYLASKISEKRAPPRPTPKKLNSKVPILLSKSPSDPTKRVIFKFGKIDILHFYQSKTAKLTLIHLRTT